MTVVSYSSSGKNVRINLCQLRIKRQIDSQLCDSIFAVYVQACLSPSFANRYFQIDSFKACINISPSKFLYWSKLLKYENIMSTFKINCSNLMIDNLASAPKPCTKFQSMKMAIYLASWTCCFLLIRVHAISSPLVASSLVASPLMPLAHCHQTKLD